MGGSSLSRRHSMANNQCSLPPSMASSSQRHTLRSSSHSCMVSSRGTLLSMANGSRSRRRRTARSRVHTLVSSSSSRLHSRRRGGMPSRGCRERHSNLLRRGPCLSEAASSRVAQHLSPSRCGSRRSSCSGSSRRLRPSAVQPRSLRSRLGGCPPRCCRRPWMRRRCLCPSTGRPCSRYVATPPHQRPQSFQHMLAMPHCM